MVIKDAILDLLVLDTARAIDQVTDLAANQGGYLINSRRWYEDSYLFGTIKMGVPSANFERTLTLLRAMGIKVLMEYHFSHNVRGRDWHAFGARTGIDWWPSGRRG